MIPYNFDYYAPNTIDEAIYAYNINKKENKAALYYGGGTEIITSARNNRINVNAVIDIKHIKECTQINETDTTKTYGCGITLTDIERDKEFLLLKYTALGIGDQTVRNKISLGGNLCGHIKYKEMMLPLLLCNARAKIKGLNAQRQITLSALYKDRMKLLEGEFIVSLTVDKEYFKLPYAIKKITREEKPNYPLFTIATIVKENRLNFAFSGLDDFPMISDRFDSIINDKSFAKEIRIRESIKEISEHIKNDIQGSADFKKFQLAKVLDEIIVELEGV